MYIFRKCPQPLIAPLIQIIIDETRKACKKQPIECGFNPADNAYEPLKLMQAVMAKTNDICLRYLDNSMLCSLPPPGPPFNIVSVCAARNKRRSMEDRHIVIHDLNTMFNIQDASPSSYYAIFDGHAGHDAAVYSAAHLHQFLAESKHFVTNPEQALMDAFSKTDEFFTEKCRVENFQSGTTAVCALLRPKEKMLYIAWVGDSQALLVSQGRILQCVEPHKPGREDEKKRIEEQGGFVSFWGTWRLNGQLAVSRAIGDLAYKPYLSAVPEIREITLDGKEDFLILACDGLWDYLSEDEIALAVYKMICKDPDNTDIISESLVNLSKTSGSVDNISVIVVFLREPSKIAADAHWANRNGSPITMDASLDNANNQFTISNGATTDNNILQKDPLLLNLTSDNYKQNGSDLSPDFFISNNEKSNGKRSASEFDDDEDDNDLGPETDVDAIDEVLSPSIVAAKALAEGIINNNPEGSFNPFMEKEEVEKAAMEIDLDLQKQQSSEFDDGQKSPRRETPTPPADAVHDVSGLEEHVADSGEDSEDEWNYIKGDVANKENINPTQPNLEVAADITEEEDPDNMSQLNPNAAEFVPVSPTRNISSPVCKQFNHLNDPVIAQSPKRASDIELSIPNPQEFENEVKSRPSDIKECSNGHNDNDDDDEHQDQNKTTQELMENLLNGKNIDEIPEFQPTTNIIASAAGNTATVPSGGDEFHFGPNAAPFTPVKLLDQSETALSTKAVFGDESAMTLTGFDDSNFSQDTNDFVPLSNKEQDPMSMSFYQDNASSDPIDLNKVQMLPDDLDDFLNKPEKQNEETPQPPLDNDQRIIQTTDLDNEWVKVDDEKELASPADEFMPEINDSVPSPQQEEEKQQQETQNLVNFDDFEEQQQQQEEDICRLGTESKTSNSTNEIEDPQRNFTSPPQPEQASDAKSSPPPLEPITPEPAPIPQIETISSPESQTSVPHLEDLSPHSSLDVSRELHVISSPVLEPEICDISNSPLCDFDIKGDEKKEESIESPIEDVTSSVKDTTSPVPISPVPEDQVQDNLISTTIEEISTNPFTSSSPVQQQQPEDNLVPESISVQETEPIVSTEIEKSQEIQESPVNDQPAVDQDQQLEMLDLDHPLMKCVYPLPPQNEQSIDNNEKINDESPTSPTPNIEITSPPSKYDLDETAKLEEPKIEVEEEKPKESVVEPEIITPAEATTVAAAATATIAAAAAATAATATIVGDKKPKPKTGTTTKKPTTTTSTTATKKPTTTTTKSTTSTLKPTNKSSTTATSTTNRLSPGKAATAKTSSTTAAAAKSTTPTSKPAPKPRTTSTATSRVSSSTTSADKKPLTNGDVKTTKSTTTTSSSAIRKVDSARPKPTGTTAKTTTAAPRPTTAPAKSTVTSKVGSLPATKPRPTNLTSKTTTARTTTSSTTTKSGPTTKTISSPKDPSPSKPRPISAPAKPRVPLTKTITKTSADAEKQNKESANKLTASRTSATRTASSAPRSTLTSTVRKTETKPGGATRTTTVTKTTTTTTKSTGTVGTKKPVEITRNIKTKTTKVEKPTQNGISTEVTEKIEIVKNVLNESSETELVKDNSPIDNKLLVETNTAD